MSRIDRLLKELRLVEQRFGGRHYGVGEIRINDMAKECADAIEKLQIENARLLLIRLTSDIDLVRLEEICEAERQGRLVVLPCKVGDTVYVHDRDGKPREMVLDTPDIRCHCAKEENICMALCDSKQTGICAYRLKNDGSDLGKTVFLTREEAEAALKEAGE